MVPSGIQRGHCPKRPRGGARGQRRRQVQQRVARPRGSQPTSAWEARALRAASAASPEDVFIQRMQRPVTRGHPRPPRGCPGWRHRKRSARRTRCVSSAWLSWCLLGTAFSLQGRWTEKVRPESFPCCSSPPTASEVPSRGPRSGLFHLLLSSLPPIASSLWLSCHGLASSCGGRCMQRGPAGGLSHSYPPLEFSRLTASPCTWILRRPGFLHPKS